MVSILASISIGGVLLLAASTLLLTYSPERMARMDYPDGDFKLYIESDRDLTDIFRDGNPLSGKLREEVLAHRRSGECDCVPEECRYCSGDGG